MGEIIVRMRGGLGNQLFIYAYARAVKKTNKDYPIYLDLREYETYKIRNYDLMNYKLSDDIKILNEKNISKYKKIYYKFTQNLYRTFVYINRKINRTYNFPFFILFSKLGLLYNEHRYFDIPDISNKKEVYIYGYYQNNRYVDLVYNELKKELILAENIKKVALDYEDAIKYSNVPVAISMRLGKDYIDAGYPICDANYYQEGYKYIQGIYPNATFYIFADEIEQAKRIFEPEEFKNLCFIEGCSACESLYLMSLCEHFVISNSSFSWWGAKLADNPQKTIVAPNLWFKNVKIEDTGLYIDNMHIINYKKES